MIANRFGALEVLAHSPEGRTPRPVPLLFIHGAYTAAWCWEEYFLPWFAARGYAAYAVSLSGHGGSRRHSVLDNFSIAHYVADVEAVVAALPEPPVLIGHSMGGMVVQKFLERQSAPAAVLMASVPPQGLWSSAVGLMFQRPGLFQDLNVLMGGGEPHLESLREALFNQPVEEAQLRRFFHRCQPESHRAVWDMTLFNLPRSYGLPAEIFPDLGHGMMLERDWSIVAQRIAAWLESQL